MRVYKTAAMRLLTNSNIQTGRPKLALHTTCTSYHTGSLQGCSCASQLLRQGKSSRPQVTVHAGLRRRTAAGPSLQTLQPARQLTASTKPTAQDDVAGYLSSLNAEQAAAAMSTHHAVRVKAGPGSGKTRVITARVAWLISECGVHPSNILTITFTRKAAAELKERLLRVLGPRSASIRAGTFHAICSQIVRQHVKLLDCGLTRNFTVLDEDESEDIMNKVMLDTPAVRAVRLPSTEHSKVAGRLKEALDSVKDARDTVHRVDDLGQEFYKEWQRRPPLRSLNPPASHALERVFTLQLLNQLFQDYHRSLRAINTVDYNDLLGLAVYLWKTHPDVLACYRGRYQHILVDEFQDTNTPQYTLVKLLKGQDNHLFVVGDTDQAIYSWRGANPLIMEQQLPNDYPDSKLMYLSNNYRSLPEVVTAASSVLSQGGLPALYKPIQPVRKDRGHVYTVRVCDCDAEARWVAHKIQELVQEEGYAPSDIAVLYRLKELNKKLQVALTDVGIQSRVVGETDFWKRAEIKDLMAYLTWTLNPHNNMALERVLAKPARGIADKTLAILNEVSEQKGVTWTGLVFGDLEQECLTPERLSQPVNGDRDALSHIPSAADIAATHGIKLTNKVLQGLDGLRRLLLLLRTAARIKDVKDVLATVLITGGYAEHLRAKRKDMTYVKVLVAMAGNKAVWQREAEDAAGNDAAGKDAAGNGAAGVNTAGDNTAGVVNDSTSTSMSMHGGTRSPSPDSSAVSSSTDATIRSSTTVVSTPAHAAVANGLASSGRHMRPKSQPKGASADITLASSHPAVANDTATSQQSTLEATHPLTPAVSSPASTPSNSPPAITDNIAPARIRAGTPASAEENGNDDLEQLSQFLEHIMLTKEADEGKEAGAADAVQLMTLHASKGLEFKVVFIIGCEQGIMPMVKLSGDHLPACPKEEKRLAYVGCTRAEDRLYLLHVQRRGMYGAYSNRAPSPYLHTLHAAAPHVVKRIQA